MRVSTFVQPVIYLIAGVGCAATALGAMLASPLKAPPPLASIHEGALQIDETGKPDLSRFQARDGTWLAYRLYPAAGEATNRVAILAHGSSASSEEMNAIGKALASAGVTAVAIDVRGHGASGGRGDIGHAGELEDDLADLCDHLRQSRPDPHFLLIGHSLGGGFVARMAGRSVGRRFDRFVLLAPFLGPEAPTNRPNEGKGRWAEVDLPRIIALVMLRRLGVAAAESLPVIAYANAPSEKKSTTSVYSFRLLADYGPDFDYDKTKAAVRAAAGRLTVIAGADDELMDAAAYERELRPLGAEVELIPGVDHIGVVYKPAALARIVEAAKVGG
jgi:pimeloyl-ACP methyl ester carboxylesterase